MRPGFEITDHWLYANPYGHLWTALRIMAAVNAVIYSGLFCMLFLAFGARRSRKISN
jgi:hypothetical protein